MDRATAYCCGGPEDAQASSNDADAALAYLLSRKDVDRTRVAVGGASCGATYGASLASRHAEITSLLVISGWVDDNSRAYIASTPSLAVLGAAAERSRSDATDAREAVSASRHPQSTAKIVEGRAHGVAMFETDAELKPAIVKWLLARLAARPAP